MLTQKLVCELFKYCEERGRLVWRSSMPRRKTKAGDLAGCFDAKGYLVIGITIDGVYKKYKGARLIWLYHNGSLPHMIDHIDRNPRNNHIENLREADRGQNARNRSYVRETKTLRWTSRHGEKYQANVRLNGTMHYLGTFDTEEEAHAHAKNFAELHLGCFAHSD